VASLYDEDATMGYPAGQVTQGREAIRELWAQVLAHRPTFAAEDPLPTLYYGEDLALTSTAPRDGAGARAQVVRKQADGSWVRIIDMPEFAPVEE